MFGNYFENFGLNIPQQSFPFEGVDRQGGLFGPTQGPDAGTGLTSPGPVAGPLGTQTSAGGPPASQSITNPTPLASGPLSPAGGQIMQPTQIAGPEAPQLQGSAPAPSTAPAAGVGSPFGRQQL